MKTYKLEDTKMVECELGEWVRLSDVKARKKEEFPEDFRRIALLFTSRCTRTKFARGEQNAWESVSVKEHDLELLEWFYGLEKSSDYDQTWHRKGQPAALLNSLNAQLDLAYALKESMRKSQPKLGTPTQW